MRNKSESNNLKEKDRFLTTYQRDFCNVNIRLENCNSRRISNPNQKFSQLTQYNQNVYDKNGFVGFNQNNSINRSCQKVAKSKSKIFNNESRPPFNYNSRKSNFSFRNEIPEHKSKTDHFMNPITKKLNLLLNYMCIRNDKNSPNLPRNCISNGSPMVNSRSHLPTKSIKLNKTNRNVQSNSQTRLTYQTPEKSLKTMETKNIKRSRNVHTIKNEDDRSKHRKPFDLRPDYCEQHRNQSTNNDNNQLMFGYGSNDYCHEFQTEFFVANESFVDYSDLMDEPSRYDTVSSKRQELCSNRLANHTEGCYPKSYYYMNYDPDNVRKKSMYFLKTNADSALNRLHSPKRSPIKSNNVPGFDVRKRHGNHTSNKIIATSKRSSSDSIIMDTGNETLRSSSSQAELTETRSNEWTTPSAIGYRDKKIMVKPQSNQYFKPLSTKRDQSGDDSVHFGTKHTLDRSVSTRGFRNYANQSTNTNNSRQSGFESINNNCTNENMSIPIDNNNTEEINRSIKPCQYEVCDNNRPVNINRNMENKDESSDSENENPSIHYRTHQKVDDQIESSHNEDYKNRLDEENHSERKCFSLHHKSKEITESIKSSEKKHIRNRSSRLDNNYVDENKSRQIDNINQEIISSKKPNQNRDIKYESMKMDNNYTNEKLSIPIYNNNEEINRSIKLCKYEVSNKQPMNIYRNMENKDESSDSENENPSIHSRTHQEVAEQIESYHNKSRFDEENHSKGKCFSLHHKSKEITGSIKSSEKKHIRNRSSRLDNNYIDENKSRQIDNINQEISDVRETNIITDDIMCKYREPEIDTPIEGTIIKGANQLSFLKKDEDIQSVLSDELTDYCSSSICSSVGYKVGFNNPNAYCFLNSVIQVLRGCVHFLKAVLNYRQSDQIKHTIGQKDEEIIFVIYFCKLMSGLKQGNVDHDALDYIQNHFISSFSGDDVNKCFMELISIINNVSKKPKIRTSSGNGSDKKFEDFRNANYGFVFDSFFGQMSFTMFCENCKSDINISYQLFTSLVIPVFESKKPIPLEQCIEKFLDKTKVETDDPMNCKCASGTVNVSLKCDITHSPLYLFIYLNRAAHYLGRKINAFITTNGNFGLTTSKGKIYYRLIAVIDHIGTIEFGHYYAKCNYETYNWWLANDIWITNLGRCDITKVVSQNTIVFLFKKMKSQN